MNLLDTDTLSLLMAGHLRVAKRAEKAGSFGIPIVTRIEVLQGRFASILKAEDGERLWRAQQYLTKSEEYISDLKIVRINEASAEKFDLLRKDRKLKKLGRADLLIASIALAYGATLVTRNLRHFRQISGLITENWAD
jgi:tRNA(fMet)-specific endonuclease VapC